MRIRKSHNGRGPIGSDRPSRNLRDDASKSREGLTTSLVYGLIPVLEVLRAGKRQIEEISIMEGGKPERLRHLFELARELRVPVRRVPRVELDRTLGDVRHQGVVARVAAARYADADELLEVLEAKIGSEDPPLVLGLDGIEDPRNMGS